MGDGEAEVLANTHDGGDALAGCVAWHTAHLRFTLSDSQSLPDTLAAPC